MSQIVQDVSGYSMCTRAIHLFICRLCKYVRIVVVYRHLFLFQEALEASDPVENFCPRDTIPLAFFFISQASSIMTSCRSVFTSVAHVYIVCTSLDFPASPSTSQLLTIHAGTDDRRERKRGEKKQSSSFTTAKV